MQEIPMDQICELARNWQAAGESWHFHVLFPGCMFNLQSNQYALVMENRTSYQTYVVYSDVGFTKVNQGLVKLLHGNKILDKEQTAIDLVDTPIKPLLERCKAYSQNNIVWHHHMFFPDCIFNQYPGKWNIVLEGRDQPQIINALYDQEPVEDLRKIEVAYFKEIDPTF